MLGGYDFGAIEDRYSIHHTFATIFHVFIAHIFMLNYLIAILCTVYENMIATGDFSYKVKRYQFIERYIIAFKDEWGYSELVIHPPPINFFLIVLVPSMFAQDAMKRSALMYSQINFWLENLVLLSY
jgi:hypothetical protein